MIHIIKLDKDVNKFLEDNLSSLERDDFSFITKYFNEQKKNKSKYSIINAGLFMSHIIDQDIDDFSVINNCVNEEKKNVSIYTILNACLFIKYELNIDLSILPLPEEILNYLCYFDNINTLAQKFEKYFIDSERIIPSDLLMLFNKDGIKFNIRHNQEYYHDYFDIEMKMPLVNLNAKSVEELLYTKTNRFFICVNDINNPYLYSNFSSNTVTMNMTLPPLFECNQQDSIEEIYTEIMDIMNILKELRESQVFGM